MELTAYIIEIDIISILVLLMVRAHNTEMALLKKSFQSFQRLVDFSILFCILNITLHLLPPSNVPAIRIINCFKVISCIFMGCSWFLTIFYTTSTTTYKLRKWIIPIIIPSILVSIYTIIETAAHLSNGPTGLHPIVWILLNILSVLYISAASVLSATKARKNRNRLHRNKLYIRSFAMILPLISLVAQAKFMDMPITSPAFVITILFLHFQEMSLRISVDETTGLNNTNKLSSYLEKITQSQDPAKRLFFLDIEVDNLNALQKIHGKESSVITLKKMASFLREQCTNRGIFLARYGKGAFAIVCECAEYSEIESFASKLAREGQKSSDLTQGPWPIMFSIYCSEFGTSETKTIDALLDNVHNNCLKPPTALA